jgi:hypothetical protein
MIHISLIQPLNTVENCLSKERERCSVAQSGQPPQATFNEAFSPRFSFAFSEYQSYEYDRPAEKYYIIKAQRERNTKPLKTKK